MYKLDFSNIESLTAEQISKLIRKHKSDTNARYQMLEGYYGTYHTGIENKVRERRIMDPSKPNHKLITNFPQYIVDISTNYLLGNPPTYTSSNKKGLEEIRKIYDLNYEQDHNNEIGKTAAIKGVAYELVYLGNDGQIYITPLDVNSTIVIEDTSIDPVITLAIRYYETADLFTGKKRYHAELYWSDRIEYWSGTSYTRLQLDTIEGHEFQEVPVVVYQNNKELTGDFENQITLIDDLELRISDSSNQGDFFNNAMLVMEVDPDALIGEIDYGLYSEEELQNPGLINERKLQNKLNDMKRRQVMVIPPDSVSSSGNKIYFLRPEINDEADRNHISLLTESIHKYSGVPDLTDKSFAGTQSGEAMKYKLLSLEQLTRKKERKFKKGLYQRLELICNILKFKGMEVDAHEFEINFSRALPISLKDTADAIKKFAETGLFSDDTLLANSSIVTDVEKEKELLASKVNENVVKDTIETQKIE